VTLGDAPLLPQSSFVVNATETLPFTGVLASFTDSGNDGTTNDYTGRVQWASFSMPPQFSPAQFQLNSDGSIAVSGSWTYSQPGTYLVSISVQDHGVYAVTLSGTVQVGTLLTDLTPQGNSLNGVEGQTTGDQVLATFSYPDPSALERRYQPARRRYR
jgi:hypothetical protein